MRSLLYKDLMNLKQLAKTYLFIIVICKDDMAVDIKRMILFHHKLKNPSRAKELYEIFCEERLYYIIIN